MSQITFEQFDDLMARSFGGVFDDFDALAVGVSGGADSMALLFLLQKWCEAQGKTLHVLSVNHGLREAAQDECDSVAAYCESLRCVYHKVLVWSVPSEVRVQEAARKARYDLMSEYCKGQGIHHLFLAHHQDDQAETVLFRLSKGSGVDGLAGMRVLQRLGNIVLCRPLLIVPKSAMVDLCAQEKIPFINDPSNEDDAYARVRMRQSMDVLAVEGLSAKRLGVTATRMARASDALDIITDKSIEDNTLLINTERIEFNLNVCELHIEILIRIILKAIDMIGLAREYAPRLERVENLVEGLQNDLSFRKRTLGGVIFERDDQGGRLILTCENPHD